MGKIFDIAGPCNPARHYMLPATARVPEVMRLVQDKAYFVVHAQRQCGKTTAFRALIDDINAKGDLTKPWDGKIDLEEVDWDRFFHSRAHRTSVFRMFGAVGALAGACAAILTADAAELARDAQPGLAVEAQIVFDAVPTNDVTFAGNDAWALTYRPQQGAGSFAFQIGDEWFHRALAEQPVQTGRVYRVRGGWNGATVSVAVEGGKSGTMPRSNPIAPARSEAVLNPFDGRVFACSAKVARAPIVHFFRFKSKDLQPRQGKPFALVCEVASLGAPIAEATLVASCKTPGATISPARRALGTFAGTRPCEWTAEAGTNGELDVVLSVESGGKTVASANRTVVVMPAEDPDLSAAKWTPPVRPTSAFYVDALRGDDAADGRSPETPWKSFRNVNGRTLGPGERILLKRGSVFNEELRLSAHGAAENWAELGAYGSGARPTIRRERMFNQRCAFVEHASYLAIRDLCVCNAGKGLCVVNGANDAGHILVERCLAHHIEGSYRVNAHGIPEWRDMKAPEGGGGGAIAFSDVKFLVFRDSETYQNSWGFNVSGEDLFLHRLYTHDNASPNTSPHPSICGTTRAWFVDSTLDASGWNASAGTMGIMLCVNRGFVIRNCHFINMPDSGSHDEGGIDFESGGEGILVDRCTFRRNAGAAIEVLGLYTPQAMNIRVRECRFDRNNFAKKLGPSEIIVYGSQERSIDTSCGLIEGCGYVLEPDITFYRNESSVSRPNWMLRGNTQYEDSAALDRAMPWGDPPEVTAGDEIWTCVPRATLAGRLVSGAGKLAWEQREGAGEAKFADATSARTDVTLPGEGDWRFALAADDGRLWRTARTAVHVLPKGSVTARAWPFAKNHDMEGWTHGNLGTRFETFKGPSEFWNTFANPVHDVVGDYYVLALKDAKGAYLLSPDDLFLSSSAARRVRLRLQNHTNAARMRLSYLTTRDAVWNEAKSAVFAVKPHDAEDALYACDLPLKKGEILARLRLDFSADPTPVTGTVRLDYIWLGR